MKKRNVKVGLAPTRRYVFSVEDAHRYKKLVEDKLASWKVDFVNIDSVNGEGLLFNKGDAGKAADLFRRERVDAVFCPHANFGTEEAVAELGRLAGKPFLLWGPRDEAPLPNGHRLRDTQCGLFATSYVLRQYGVPFTYIVNSRVDDPVFERGFKNFLCAARAANAFLGARIGQVSTRPANFYTVIVNEGELLERWGIETVPITLVDIEKGIEGALRGDRRVPEVVADFKSRVAFKEVDDEAVKRLTALKLTLMDWAERERLTAIAFKCWEELQRAVGVFPCFINSELTAAGVPVACETDVLGALTSVLLMNAWDEESPTFFADVTVRHPENDNAELLWHCGPFPLELAKEGAPAFVGRHFIIPPGEPGTGNWEIRGGDVTIDRLGGLRGRYSLFMGHGRGIGGPYTLGTYLWVEVPDWPLWEERLIKGPYIHHVAGAHGKAAYALYEAGAFIPGLAPDPVQPTEEEIGAHLRGKNP